MATIKISDESVQIKTQADLIKELIDRIEFLEGKRIEQEDRIWYLEHRVAEIQSRTCFYN